MGIDTKILLTGETDILNVLRFAHETFKGANLQPAGHDFYWLNFKDGEDQRGLSVFPADVCASDYADVHTGPAILMSMGMWGNSEIIARKFAAKFGGLFMVDDSNGEWQSMPERTGD